MASRTRLSRSTRSTRTSDELSSDEAANIPQVPGTLADVLDALEADNEYLQAGGVFTDDLIETWVAYKRENEIDPIRLPASSRVRLPTTSESNRRFVADTSTAAGIEPGPLAGTWVRLLTTQHWRRSRHRYGHHGTGSQSHPCTA